MNSLAQDEINKIIENIIDNSLKIVSCGVDPRDGDVSLIISNGELRIFSPKEYYVPPGVYIPQSNGEEVFLPNDNGRWPGTFDGFKVKSKWLIEHSETALKAADLYVGDNYLCEIKASSS
jgi:hypothetical protein